MDHIGGFLSDILQKKNLSDSVDAARVVGYFHSDVLGHIPSALHHSVLHVSFSDGCLWIHLPNSVVLCEFGMHKNTVLEKMQAQFHDVVGEIRFKIGQAI